MSLEIPTRDELYVRYVDQLPYEPYPVQDAGAGGLVRVRAGRPRLRPTGTGKTLIAQAALFEALHTGKVAYYTTPLIALTEQKFQEMQDRAVEWGFRREDVGLVTGNRKVNPEAPVLVVVAEILLNRLLNRVRLLRRVGLRHGRVPQLRRPGARHRLGAVARHAAQARPPAAALGDGRQLGRVRRLAARQPRPQDRAGRGQGTQGAADLRLGARQVPHRTARRDGGRRRGRPSDARPGLLLQPRRVLERRRELKGKDLNLSDEQEEGRSTTGSTSSTWPGGRPEAQAMLHRGVGVHHAGLLPKYRRVVEDLFQRKLLSVVVCTETLAAGINLPARSVVLSSLVKGPFGKEKLIDPSIAHQIFGRAGRPQFDDRGYVYALAHEDDVEILRWKEKYDQIPEDTRDPGLMKAKKALKKKKPKRRETEQYWVEGQFNQLQAAPPGKLYSKGPLPWRLLAYLLKVSPEVEGIRAVVRKRLMDDPRIAAGEKELDRMLLTLHAGGFVTLTPSRRRRRRPASPRRLTRRPWPGRRPRWGNCWRSGASIPSTAPS